MIKQGKIKQFLDLKKGVYKLLVSFLQLFYKI